MAVVNGEADFSFNAVTFCVVTGASKGLGRSIAVKLSEKLGEGSVVLLLARDKDNLEETREMVRERTGGAVKVSTRSVDLSRPDPATYQSILDSVLADHGVKANQFRQAIIAHNAGSLGNIKKLTTQMDDPEEMRQYFDLNLTSALCLNAKFLKLFGGEGGRRRFVINITSLAAFHPFKSWGYYCAGKAARDMIFRVMAAEDPSLRVLSYSPGPLQTDMTVTAREDTADPEVKQWFIDAYAQGKLLTVDVSVNRLIQILELNNFKSGDHVDIYDELEDKSAVASE